MTPDHPTTSRAFAAASPSAPASAALDPKVIAVSMRGSLEELALLLDVDGTLVDIAPTPSEVEASPALIDTLLKLIGRTGGAVALVSGRTIAELDSIFSPVRLPAIGGHGAEFRPIVGEPVALEGARPLDAQLKARLTQLAAMDERVLIEDKGYSIALHFRLAPGLRPAIEASVTDILARLPSHSVELLRGKAVLEIKSCGFDKGSAVRKLMQLRPFAGRRPVFVGDDTTDESAFAALPDFNGIGISVGRPLAAVAGHFTGPPAVRDWLARIAQVEQPSFS